MKTILLSALIPFFAVNAYTIPTCIVDCNPNCENPPALEQEYICPNNAVCTNPNCPNENCYQKQISNQSHHSSQNCNNYKQSHHNKHNRHH